MDLDKQADILFGGDGSPEPLKTSLFEAVRRWTNAEETRAFDIELDGTRLTREQIQELAHSAEYKERLLAFDLRL